jgi:hypothetical protein
MFLQSSINSDTFEATCGIRNSIAAFGSVVTEARVPDNGQHDFKDVRQADGYWGHARNAEAHKRQWCHPATEGPSLGPTSGSMATTPSS